MRIEYSADVHDDEDQSIICNLIVNTNCNSYIDFSAPGKASTLNEGEVCILVAQLQAWLRQQKERRRK